MNQLAALFVLLAGTYLLALAAATVVSPQRTQRFLGSFASSAAAHFLELFVRLIMGAALVLHAPRMRFSGVFTVFGWVVLVTTVALFAMPWRWHRRFAKWSVPMATSNMKLFAFGSLLGGLFVIVSFFLGPASG